MVERGSLCFPTRGFGIKGQESKVYRLTKALYGLRQAPRAWNEKLNKVLGELQIGKCSK